MKFLKRPEILQNWSFWGNSTRNSTRIFSRIYFSIFYNEDLLYTRFCRIPLNVVTLLATLKMTKISWSEKSGNFLTWTHSWLISRKFTDSLLALRSFFSLFLVEFGFFGLFLQLLVMAETCMPNAYSQFKDLDITNLIKFSQLSAKSATQHFSLLVIPGLLLCNPFKNWLSQFASTFEDFQRTKIEKVEAKYQKFTNF